MADDVSDDVYIYRDISAEPDDAAAAAPGFGSDERDASYWYDLSGEDGASGEAAAQVTEQTRGPFEPLVSSDAPAASAQPGTAYGGGRHAAPGAAGHDGHEESAHAQAHRLEQIKDFYLTAEAIGERNVDKHFDELLAQQRELISEYFKQSGDRSDPAAGQAPPQGEGDRRARPAQETGQEDRGRTGRGAPVIAEPPSAW